MLLKHVFISSHSTLPVHSVFRHTQERQASLVPEERQMAYSKTLRGLRAAPTPLSFTPLSNYPRPISY